MRRPKACAGGRVREGGVPPLVGGGLGDLPQKILKSNTNKSCILVTFRAN